MTGAALHERYRRMGHESVWLSSDLPPLAAPPPGYVRVPASDLPFRTVGVAYPLWTPRAAAMLREQIAWCDVVNPHDCLYPGTLLALRHARRAGKPLVLTQHAGPWPFYRSPVLRAVQLAAYRTLGPRRAPSRRAGGVHQPHRAGVVRRPGALSAPVALHHQRRRHDACSGTATPPTRRAARQRLGLPLDRRIVLYVGRFLFMKGLPVIEALARRDPDTLFVLIGAGPLDPRQWNLAQRRRAAVPGRRPACATTTGPATCSSCPPPARAFRWWSWRRWCAARRRSSPPRPTRRGTKAASTSWSASRRPTRSAPSSPRRSPLFEPDARAADQRLRPRPLGLGPGGGGLRGADGGDEWRSLAVAGRWPEARSRIVRRRAAS